MNDIVKNELARLQKQFDIANEAGIVEHLTEKITETETSNRRRLLKEDPFVQHRFILEAARADFDKKNYTTKSIRADLKSYLSLAKQYKSLSDKSFWEKSISEIKEQEQRITQSQKNASEPTGTGKKNQTGMAKRSFNMISAKAQAALHKKKQTAMHKKLHAKQKILRGLLHDRWQELLDKEHSNWELETIKEYRYQLFAQLEKWLRYLQQLAEVMRQLSITPGLLFDLSKDNMSLSNIEELKRWAEYLARDEGARQLCEMLGRLRRATRAKREEWIKTTEVFHTFEPDTNSREEITGVCIGDNIEYALAEEKALLADDETADLFYLKFAEKRLLQFDAQGFSTFTESRENDVLIEVSEDEKMGPMIICVDTSGSMQGSPETIVKAVTLYLATKSISQKRNCYLINFSTNIETLDLSGHVSLPTLIQFLRRTFGGGTDVAPAVKHALAMMKTENYKKSDLLIISDFLMNGLPEELCTQILSAKDNENKFFSLAIGEDIGKNLKTNLTGLFENEWVYAPKIGNIRQLLDCADATA